MAEIGLAVAQTLFAALQCSQLQEICSIWGYKSRLEELKKTVTTIKKVLMDAESKELTHEAQGYIEDLKDALYEADDLFDEFVTLLEVKQLQGSRSKHGEFFQKVRHFFSSDQNQVSQAYRMFHNVKKIQKKLCAIAENHKTFKLDVDYKPICMRREETCSYVYVEKIVGRDDNKKTIINKLLESKNQGVCFLTIVGVGGLGKTALAQLVYNDKEVKQEFGDLCYWVCVSDQDQQEFNVKAILCKIVEVVTRKKSFDVSCSFEIIHKEFQEKLGGKKYLLVLDDVWNEDLHKWDTLQNFLMSSQGGSRVIVTTRSEITAGNIRQGWTYRLEGLSTENSWHLFEMSAFSNGGDQQAVNHIEMVDIGRRIVEKCNNVPLAIKVVGSLLFGQGIDKWRSFENSGLAQIDNVDNKIMSVLKLSYHNLRSSLKSCFSFCAVFPKDFEIEKRLLINLWMAQGYIVPSNRGQSIEDAAEEHFSILLRRCFFQNVKKDKYDDVKSVNIHDLMHDVAQEVGGGEIQVLSSAANEFGDRTRHVSLVDKCFESSSNWTNLRSLIRIDYTPRNWKGPKQLMDISVGSWRSLRVLDLRYMGGGSSLESIGKMQHLRYLDLSKSNFKELPSSITKLHNLQTLNLYDCEYLRQLPQGFSKLVNLSHLDLVGCWELTSMPMGLDKLTGLRVLTRFVAGMKKNQTGKECDDELKDLGTLTNLTGCIHIDIGENYRNVQLMKNMNEGYLSKMSGLKEVNIEISEKCIEAEAEAVLEKLQPHPELKELVLEGYGGKTIPRWGRAEDNWAIFLPNLIKIEIANCKKWVYLPSFSKLPRLKIFRLADLDNLEYIEKRSSSTKEATDTTFFPSLNEFRIEDCKKWEGWFGEEGLADADYGLSLRTTFRFPCLSELYISCCPNLASFPPCPSVGDILLSGVNKTSQLLKKIMGKEELHICHHVMPYVKGLELRGYGGKTIPRWGRAEDNWAIFLPNLFKIEIGSCDMLVYLPSFSKLPRLKIFRLADLDNLEYIEKRSSSTKEATDTTFFPSLTEFRIWGCGKWKGWFGEEGLADADLGTTFRFPCLSQLYISYCPSLASFPPCPSVEHITLHGVNKTSQLLKKIMGKEEGEVTLGTSSSSCLHRLGIGDDTELESLSEFENVFGMCASSLRSLSIQYCNRLTRFSRGLEHLTALESLQIVGNRQLSFSEDDNEDIMPWKPLHQNLRSLELDNLKNITSLPKGMQYLTSLQTLEIERCEKLKSLPEWISSLSSLQSLSIKSCKAMESLPEGIQNLTSLQNLKIVYCDRLEERCREPDGEDWPKIQHILNIKIRY